jgi:hypothetical protein
MNFPRAATAGCRAPIARWSLWDSRTAGSAAPDVGFVEPMQRRRLSSLAKMSLRVAHDCVHDLTDFRMVYASRHGELKRTVGMLEALADGETLSPTAFSLAVPNATAGIYSILRQNHAASTAIAAGASSFGFGLLEAGLQLACDPGSPVLLVYADEPVPDVYAGVTEQAECAAAIAMLLSPGAASAVECRIDANGGEESTEPQWASFLRCLERKEPATWTGDGRRWAWSFAEPAQ